MASAPHSHTPILGLAFLSDVHLTGPEGTAPLRAAIAALNAEPPDFVVLGGDLMDTGRPEEWSALGECLHPLRVPCHWLAGNHDLGNTGDAQRWVREIGPLNSAWEAAGVHCLALDTTNTDPDPENWHGRVEAPALEWLRGALAATPPGAPLLLLTHHGLVGVPDDLSCDVENAGTVLDLFRGRRLVAGLAGHSHRLLLNRWERIPFLTAPALSSTRPCIGVPPGFLRVDLFPDEGFRVRLEVALW